MDVIGVGDIDVDIYLDVDYVPGRDEKVVAKHTQFYPGGMVANFIVALQRLGTACSFHGPMGDDAFGKTALQDLSDNQVDTSTVVVKPGGQTYFCVVMLDHTGEKSLVVAQTDCSELAPDELSEEAISRAKHMHTTLSGSTTTALDYAKRHGLTTSVDLEPGSMKRVADIKGLLSQVDIAFVNHKAASMLSAAESLAEAAKEILDFGPKIVCITLGSDGLVAVSKDEVEPVKVDAFTVDVVDSTGAGDCFAAGFVHGFLSGWDLRSTAIFASAAAALNIGHYGGHGGAPTFEKVSAFLFEKGIEFPFIKK